MVVLLTNKKILSGKNKQAEAIKNRKLGKITFNVPFQTETDACSTKRCSTSGVIHSFY
jgi:hypothetical protein